jgi:plasmid replication initiation protein
MKRGWEPKREVIFSTYSFLVSTNRSTNHEVLTLDHAYFRLDGDLERRIYELCRKHYGHQPSWSIGLDLLYKKSGSRAPLRNFRLAIKKLAESNHLPEYRLRFTSEDDKGLKNY